VPFLNNPTQSEQFLAEGFAAKPPSPAGGNNCQLENDCKEFHLLAVEGFHAVWLC